MTKIAFIGAGSTVFARNLIGDVLATRELSGSTFALMDVDPGAEWDKLRARMENGDAAVDLSRSDEYGADIIRACETGEPFAFNGNVPNSFEGRPLIDNLPPDCCVEVPCVASERGIEPQPVGALPRHLAALIQTNVGVQGLIVDAALNGSRESVYHAAMLDPHTAAELSLDEVRRLVDDLLEAHGDWIPPLAAGAAR